MGFDRASDHGRFDDYFELVAGYVLMVGGFDHPAAHLRMEMYAEGKVRIPYFDHSMVDAEILFAELNWCQFDLGKSLVYLAPERFKIAVMLGGAHTSQSVSDVADD